MFFTFEIFELLLFVLLLSEGVRYYNYLLLVLLEETCVSYNQRGWDKRSRDTRKQVSKLLSFFLPFFFSLQVVNYKNKKQKHCNALLAKTTTRCRTSQQRCEVQRVAATAPGCRSSTVLLAIAAAMRSPAHCCNSAARTLQVTARCRPVPQQCCKLQCSVASCHRRSGG
jgi:hypothetical protein